MQLSAYAKTHVGNRRDNNEDNFLLLERHGLFGVADGMGGHDAGEVASALAVMSIQEEFLNSYNMLSPHTTTSDVDARLYVLGQLTRLVKKAHLLIFEAARREQQKRGMGTTLDLLFLSGNNAYLTHVGDSRMYLFRSGTLYPLTEDHTLAARQLRNGEISLEDFAASPVRNVIYQALGVVSTLEIDTLHLDVYPKDTFLLCTDGLYESISTEEIVHTLETFSGEDAVEQLVRQACALGGHDNITVVLVSLQEDVPQPLAPIETYTKISFLQQLPLFAVLSYQEMLQLLTISVEQPLHAGELFVEEGATAEMFLVVLTGAIQIELGGVTVATLGPGGHFGEMTLVSPQERSAAVRSTEETRLLVFRREDFVALTRTEPELAVKLLWGFVDTLSGRVKELSKELIRRRE